MSVICTVGIVSSGVADSMIKAVHLRKTRHAHQVTAAALYVLVHESYGQYKETTQDGGCGVVCKHVSRVTPVPILDAHVSP